MVSQVCPYRASFVERFWTAWASSGGPTSAANGSRTRMHHLHSLPRNSAHVYFRHGRIEHKSLSGRLGSLVRASRLEPLYRNILVKLNIPQSGLSLGRPKRVRAPLGGSQKLNRRIERVRVNNRSIRKLPFRKALWGVRRRGLKKPAPHFDLRVIPSDVSKLLLARLRGFVRLSTRSSVTGACCGMTVRFVVRVGRTCVSHGMVTTTLDEPARNSSMVIVPPKNLSAGRFGA